MNSQQPIASMPFRKRRKSYRNSSIICFLLVLTVVQSFAPQIRVTLMHNELKYVPPSTPRTGRIRNTNRIKCKESLYAGAKSSEPGDRGLLQRLNGEMSDLILDRLNKKANGHASSTNHHNEGKKKTYQAAAEGLSKFHRSILSTTSSRQRCVTGEYPLKITVQENPTRKWLSSGSTSRYVATSQMLVNGTSVERSLASYERFQWLEDDERTELHEGHTLFSMELLAEINVKKPGYVNMMIASDAGFAAKREKNEAELSKNRYQLPFNQRNEHALNGESKVASEERILATKRELHERMLEMESERMWITGFSLTKQSGELNFVDVKSGRMGSINKQTASAIRWPNEVNSVPVQRYHHDTESAQDETNGMHEDALLVSDGFLVPGRDNGGLYVVSRPGHEMNEWRVCLAGGNGVDGLLSKLESKKNDLDNSISKDEDGWFYHRSIWIDLTGDGRQSVLTARAKRPSLVGSTPASASEESLPAKAQLVWLERPKPHSYDKSTGTPLDKDGLIFDSFGPKHTPWKVRVLDEGPDVMFSVADMDTTDDTVEVFASQFFSKKLTMHSIQRGPIPRVVFRRTLDERCGASFSSVLANLDSTKTSDTRKIIDSGSTVPTLKSGDCFSHLLITSHECTSAADDDSDGSKFVDSNEYTTEVRTDSLKTIDGGSLFSYRVPDGKDAWKTAPWLRSVIATGFRVKGQLGNMINPGAPGFCYTFYPTKDGPKPFNGTINRPLIAIAGDCAESAYILRPADSSSGEDPSANYSLMCEIECGATVGSIGIGYEDFCYAPQQSGYAKIYIPQYENDKVLVFALGNGEDDESNDGW